MHSSILKIPAFKASVTVNLAIEMTNSSIKLAAVQTKGGIRELIGYATANIRDINEGADFIHDFLTSKVRTRNRDFTISDVKYLASIPRHLISMKFMDLPSLDASELKNMAHFQAIAGLPFSEEDLVSDMLILNQDKIKGISRILLIVGRKNHLQPYFDLFNKLGRTPDGFVLGSFGLIESVKKVLGHESDYSQVDLNDEWLEINVIHQDKLISSRCVPLRLNDKACERIVKEYLLSMESLGEKFKSSMKRIIISGMTPVLFEEIKQKLEKENKINVDMLSPDELFPAYLRTEELSPVSNPNKYNTYKDQDGYLSPSIIGAAFLDDVYHINLLPRNEIERNLKRNKVKNLKSLGLSLALWLVSLGGISLWTIWQKNSYISSLTGEIRKLEPEAKKVSGILERVTFLKSQMNLSASPLETLREIHRLVPSSIAINSLSYDSGGTLNIQGTAPNLSQVIELVNNLGHSSIFSKAELRNSSTRIIQQNELVDFQVLCVMEARG